MSQLYGSNSPNNMGAYNPYPASYNPNGGFSSPNGMGNFYYNDLAPIFGPMQGGGNTMGIDAFGAGPGAGSGSASQDYLSSLLNLGPLQAQTNQMMGGNGNQGTTDPSSPLAYVNNTLAPIMSGAEQTYNQAMGATSKQTSPSQSGNTGGNSSNAGSSSSSTTNTAPTSIPLEDSGSSGGDTSSASSSADDSESG